jgi:hypothetical protein
MTNQNSLQQFESRVPQTNLTGNIESNRAIAEVQGQILMAKQFPRDQIQARFNILEACKRRRLAETALYSYPRGGTQIEGPSIRLAEMMAQNWGNIDYGVIELEQKSKESIVMAYARDIQTNTRQQVIFTVPHSRYSRKRGNTILSDPRDIYEMIANQGARRLRKCILGIIPGDIVEEAVDACNRTLLGNNDEPIIDRVKKMVGTFAGVGVTQAMIEKRLGHKMEVTLPIEIVRLGKIYKSLSDGMSKIEDWFEPEITKVDMIEKPSTGKNDNKKPKKKPETEQVEASNSQPNQPDF